MANYVLEILDGDRAGDVCPVADRPLRIGRKPGNDLVLADEKTSGVHAEVVLEGDRHVLRDLGSTNGTFLDGKRVTELVLTPGDVVTIGRLRLRFRAADGPAGGAEAPDLAVRRLDAGRLPRRGGSLGLLAALVVLGLGAAGYLWWQGRTDGGEDRAAPRQRPPVVVSGNRLAAAVAACDTEQGWQLRAAGLGFQPTTRSHTGAGAFEALPGEGEGAPDFALATLQDPLRFRLGTPLAAHAGWQRIEAAVAVPAGCDRLQLELVAVLPTADAVAVVDDVAVVEGGTGTAVEQKLAESGQTLLGAGSSVGVRSVDPDNPATLFELLPHTVPPALDGLHRAGLCVLSDLGAGLTVQATERSFQFAVEGVADLQLVFAADAAGGLLVAGADEAFVAAAAESEFTAARLVLGDRATRALLRFAAPTPCRGQIGGGRYRLRVQAAGFELVLGFRGERQQASELVRQARSALAQGQPGRALDALRELVRTLPMDSEVLGQAQELRTQVLAQQADALRQLQQDLDEAEFFDTRGGFARVVRGIDEVVASYGEGNLEDAAGIAALRERASGRLQAIEAADVGARRQRLLELAKAFADGRQAGLAQVVEAYVQQHLEGK